MTWVQALVLGLVQGATEFLPISSSGHLVLVPWILDWEFDRQVFFTFTVFVHWGTVLAVVLSMRRELWSVLSAAWRDLSSRRPFATPQGRLAWLLILAAVPAGVAGLALNDQVQRAFDQPRSVGLLLWLTAGILFFGDIQTRRVRAKLPLASIRPVDALVIGLAQTLALLPGVSRSGTTIAAGLNRGLGQLEAARFSFLLALPVMLGAGALALADLAAGSEGSEALIPLLIGFLSAAAVGAVSIRWLLGFLSRGSLRPFAIYCALAGAGAMVVSLFRA